MRRGQQKQLEQEGRGGVGAEGLWGRPPGEKMKLGTVSSPFPACLRPQLPERDCITKNTNSVKSHQAEMSLLLTGRSPTCSDSSSNEGSPFPVSASATPRQQAGSLQGHVSFITVSRHGFRRAAGDPPPRQRTKPQDWLSCSLRPGATASFPTAPYGKDRDSEEPGKETQVSRVC